MNNWELVKEEIREVYREMFLEYANYDKAWMYALSYVYAKHTNNINADLKTPVEWYEQCAINNNEAGMEEIIDWLTQEAENLCDTCLKDKNCTRQEEIPKNYITERDSYVYEPEQEAESEVFNSDSDEEVDYHNSVIGNFSKRLKLIKGTNFSNGSYGGITIATIGTM